MWYSVEAFILTLALVCVTLRKGVSGLALTTDVPVRVEIPVCLHSSSTIHQLACPIEGPFGNLIEYEIKIMILSSKESCGTSY